MDKSIQLSDLKVGYGQTVVLNNIEFTIAEGEIVCLIGANGSGKSTVLKTITGQLKKLGGIVYLNGKDKATMSEPEVAKVVSMVMTEKIHPELMTCFEVVATGRYPYTNKLGFLSENDKAAILEAIDMVGAAPIIDKDFSKISDGQRQRIMLARAICQDARVMILDEPTSFLDLQYKLDIISVIKKMARIKKVAILMSIHELEFVPAVADKVIGIAGDEVYVLGTPKEVLTGEHLEKMYNMSSGTGNELCQGLWEYSKSIAKLLN